MLRKTVAPNERLRPILGARLLETQMRVGEAAEAIELRQSGENSVPGVWR